MPTCNKATFEASACWGYTCQDDKTRKAMQMRLLILELQAVGGPDYRTSITGLSASVASIRELKRDQIASALAGVYARNATVVGATVGTVNQIRGAAQCYVCLQDDLDLYLLQLQCLLGTHTGV